MSALDAAVAASIPTDMKLQTPNFIEAVVLAAVEGRVAETFIGRRSKVTVTLDDGSVVTESGGRSLPWPWLRCHTIQYQPYRTTS
jgi:hypothetical protein